MSNKTIKLSSEDISSLKIIFTFLASDLSKGDIKEMAESKQYPPRLKALASILSQVDPDFINQNLNIDTLQGEQ